MNNKNDDINNIDWKDNKIKWDDIIKKEARGYEKGDDLGEVQEIGQEFVVTERGRISKNKFYLPKFLVKGYDGETLWFNITEEDAEDNFKKERPPKAGEYSRYRAASVTQQPPESSGNQTNYNQRLYTNDLEEYLPLIEKRNTNKENKEGSVITEQKQQENTSGIKEWDSIIHKGVRTEDMIAVGNVVAVNNRSVIITTEGAKEEYNIPKEEIKSFNGSEVILKAVANRLDQFKVKVPT